MISSSSSSSSGPCGSSRNLQADIKIAGDRARSHARHFRLKAAGLCVDCGCAPARPNRTTCAPCGRIASSLTLARVKARYEKLKAAGLCVKCARVPAAEGVLACEPCGAIHRARLVQRISKGAEKAPRKTRQQEDRQAELARLTAERKAARKAATAARKAERQAAIAQRRAEREAARRAAPPRLTKRAKELLARVPHQAATPLPHLTAYAERLLAAADAQGNDSEAFTHIGRSLLSHFRGSHAAATPAKRH